MVYIMFADFVFAFFFWFSPSPLMLTFYCFKYSGHSLSSRRLLWPNPTCVVCGAMLVCGLYSFFTYVHTGLPIVCAKLPSSAM